MAKPKVTTQLLADVGGTNTRVALARDFDVDRETVRKYPNRSFSSLDAVLQAYLHEMDVAPGAAAVAVAGPVRDGDGQLTNLDWAFDDEGLAHSTGVPVVRVLNDLQAQGHALSSLTDRTTKTLVRGKNKPEPHETQLVVGVGTGFNAAAVFNAPGGRLVTPSECGHVTLAQDTPQQRQFADWLERGLGFASIEDALSGRGIEAVYGWEGFGPPAEKSSVEIFQSLERQSDPRAEQTLQLFVDLLGAAIGNLALIHLPYGGIYLIGGMARAVAPHLERFGFEKALVSKGRFSDLISEFSVHIVDDDFIALNGCASYLKGLN